MSIIRDNLMNIENYSPYCCSNSCDNPRSVFNGTQFVCPKCGYTTTFPRDFISEYKKKWNK